MRRHFQKRRLKPEPRSARRVHIIHNSPRYKRRSKRYSCGASSQRRAVHNLSPGPAACFGPYMYVSRISYLVLIQVTGARTRSYLKPLCYSCLGLLCRGCQTVALFGGLVSPQGPHDHGPSEHDESSSRPSRRAGFCLAREPMTSALQGWSLFASPVSSRRGHRAR